MVERNLTAQRLRELLHYDPETGTFTRLTCTRGWKAKVGTRDVAGHIRMGIGNRDYLAHRLAWLYVNGAWPTGFLDHINGNPADNRLANLRVASRRMNAENQRRAHSDNATGFLGVTRKRTKFVAQLTTNGRTVYLGSFVTPEEAYSAYLAGKRLSHHGCTI